MGEVRPVQRPLYRAASWVVVVVVLASTFAAVLGTVAASSPSYTLAGFVDQPAGSGVPPAPVPAGVPVDLVSRGSGAVFSTTTGSGGYFKFTSSGTSSALGPGYWGLYVPVTGQSAISGCRPYKCAVLPEQQTVQYQYFSASLLTHPSNTQLLPNITVLPYNATVNGTVHQGAGTVAGASIRLLDPQYAGLVLASNSSNATGFYSLSVPFGTWVLQASHTAGSNLYTNSSVLTVTTQKVAPFSPVLKSYAIGGRIYSSLTHSYVTVGGNATLYDPTNGYLYSTPTPTGGYYSFASYPASFTGKSAQQFYVILASAGFQTDAYSLNVTTPTPVTKSVTVSPMTTAERGVFATKLDFGGLDPSKGKGNLVVSTNVTLGNDSSIPGLPNATVGQLWAQLGLDFDHSVIYSGASSNAKLQSWVVSQGPFFPAVQAGTSVNGTTFVGPKTAQGTTNFTFASGCSTTCGLRSSKTVSYNWITSYPLNGTIAKNSSSYTISFKFAHPTVGSDVYDYSLHLPSGYVLAAHTAPPANTSLVGIGPGGTWTNFTLVSKVGTTTSATATFKIVRASTITARVSVLSSNPFFSTANVLNSTHNNYTVVLGENQVATYSSAPTTYPSGQNGTQFVWNFGNGHSVTTTNLTTNYSYTAPNGSSYYKDTLTVYGSAGGHNTTTFFVWVLPPTSVPAAGIASNASAAERFTSGGVPYLFVPWSTTLHFNASAGTKIPNNPLSVALYTVSAMNYTKSQNFSAAKGATPYYANWTVAFGQNTSNTKLAPGHGLYVNFDTIKVGGVTVLVKGWGWVYTLTLSTWSVIGTKSTASLTILINDTEPPAPTIALLNSAGKTIPGSSVTEGPNHYVSLKLNGAGSTDYGNGSIVSYTWLISNPGNSSFKNISYSNTSATPYPKVKLFSKSSNYKIKLTVADKNGEKANLTRSFAVNQNTTLRPILEANNLTGPSSLNAGTSYSFWVNVTVSGGSKATANTVSVVFYTLNGAGSGNRGNVGGAPSSVVFYGYTGTGKNATVNSTALGTGSLPSLAHGKTVRAVVSWSPSKSGSFILYAQVRAANAFVNNSSVSIAQKAITVHPNPTTQLLEYAGIGAGVVVVLAVLVLWWRRRTGKSGGASKPAPGRAGLERGGKRPDDDEDE
jgi:hypothetical protein